MRRDTHDRADRALVPLAALLSTILTGLLLAPDVAAATRPEPLDGPDPTPLRPDVAPERARESIVPTVGLLVSAMVSLAVVLWVRRL